jgi:hypothetical protein
LYNFPLVDEPKWYLVLGRLCCLIKGSGAQEAPVIHLLIASINQNRGKEKAKRCPNQKNKQKQKNEHEPVVVGNPTTPIISKLGSKSIISNLGLT